MEDSLVFNWIKDEGVYCEPVIVEERMSGENLYFLYSLHKYGYRPYMYRN